MVDLNQATSEKVVYQDPSDQVILEYCKEGKDGSTKVPEKVRISWQGQEWWLKPGERARLTREGARKNVADFLAKHITHNAKLAIIEFKPMSAMDTGEKTMTAAELESMAAKLGYTLQQLPQRPAVATTPKPADNQPTKAQLRADLVLRAKAAGVKAPDTINNEVLESMLAGFEKRAALLDKAATAGITGAEALSDKDLEDLLAQPKGGA